MIAKIIDAYESDQLYWSVLKSNSDGISILSVTEPFTDEGSISVLAETTRLNDLDYVFSCIKDALENMDNVYVF